MKNLLSGFYNPVEAELNEAWMDKKTLIVFDTNTLINLYGYAEKTREDFFLILGSLNRNIWIPYHVGLEYQRNRMPAIKREKAVFKDIEKLLNRVEKVFENDFQELALERRFPKLHDNTKKLEKDLSRLFRNYRQSVSHWDKNQPCVRAKDQIRVKLDKLFNDKVGNPPESQKVIDDFSKEGLQRYENRTPPGYMDEKKDKDKEPNFVYGGIRYERKFGDLVIWKQLIDKASDKNIKNVILVTDDAKEDWWYIIESRGKKTIGPRAELREEIKREADIDLFAMYNTSGFLEAGKQLLGLDIDETSIDDASNSFEEGMLFNDFFKEESKTRDERLYLSPFTVTDSNMNSDESRNNLGSYNWDSNSRKHYINEIEKEREVSTRQLADKDFIDNWEKNRKNIEELLKRLKKN